MKTSNPSQISKSVIRQIKRGDVSMRPRAYFTALSILSLAIIAISGIVISYLFSIIVFWLRIQTADSMAWGARANLSETLSSFPLWTVLAGVILITIAVWLIRRQGTTYRYKTASVVIALLLVSSALGIALSFIGIGTSHTGNGQKDSSQIQRGAGQQGQNPLAR